MAKKMSRGGKRFLSLIFHLVVLVGMVIAYERARELLKGDNAEKAEPNKAASDKEASPKETKGQTEARGTSMEDLMAEKQRRAKEKAAKEKKSD